MDAESKYYFNGKDYNDYKNITFTIHTAMKLCVRQKRTAKKVKGLRKNNLNKNSENKYLCQILYFGFIWSILYY
jgi:transcriptional regulator of met regulon